MKRSPAFIALGLAVSACGGASPKVAGLASTTPGAVIEGRLESASQALGGGLGGLVPAHPGVDAALTVNGEVRAVAVERDGSFVIKELPPGTLDARLRIGSAQGQITLPDVKRGEVVELSVRQTGDALDLGVADRNTTRPAYAFPSYRTAGLQITDGGADYFLGSGTFIGNLEIDAADVRVFGRNRDEPCPDRMRAIFSGDVIIRGQKVEVYDVAMRGRLMIYAEAYRVSDPCDGIFRADGQL